MDPLTCASKLQLDARSAGEAQSSSSPRQRSTFSLLEPWSGALLEGQGQLFIYRKQHQGESHKAGSGDGSGQKDLEAGGLNEPGGHRGSLVITVRPDGSEDTITPCPREEGEKSLKTLTRVMALTGFGPGHCDRAVPHLLYTTWYSEFEPPEKLRKDYDREIQTLCATGITRDGWCYIVMYSVVGKVMMDFIVVAILLCEMENMPRLVMRGCRKRHEFRGAKRALLVGTCQGKLGLGMSSASSSKFQKAAAESKAKLSETLSKLSNMQIPGNWKHLKKANSGGFGAAGDSSSQTGFAR
eukprot:g6718.t1